MAQGIPENLSGEQLPIPDPIRYETHSLLGDAQETITTTQCSADLYNESTINFEQGREECKQESCEARAELMHDIGITGRLQNRGRELLLRMQYGRELIDNGYTETHLLGYNNIDGNYAIEVQDFENILQGTPPEDWNSLALVNYFKLLDAGDNFSIGNLINKLGASQIIALGELWKTQPNGPAMRYFQENSELSWILGENGVSRIDFATYIDEGNIGDITNILRLIDHSSEQQSETQQVIFYALFDLFNTIDFDEPQEGKLQTLNQLSNLSGDDSSMIQYLKNTARTMVVAVDLIRNTYNEYSKVEQYGDPKPDIYVLEALIKTILQGTIIEEDSEETLEHWLGSLNEIIIHHNTEHNTIYPTFDDSLIENFLHVRFATEDTRKLSDLQIRIERIDGEMDGLLEAGMGTSERYRVLSIEKSHLQRTISNLNARYESRVSDIQASVNLFAEGRELSAGDIRYILENPLARISRVKNTAQLLDIFRNPQVDLTHLKLENINPFARRNPEIIIHFPGLLNFSSPGLLEPQVLANKDVLEKFLSSRVYFIGPIIQKMSGIQGTNIEDMFYSSLEELSQDYPIPSMYRNSLLRDDEFNINYSEDEARRYETSNSTYSESEAIQDLETLTVNSSEEIITKIQNFIRFRRPNSDLFKDTILNLVNRDVELYKIVLGPRERLRINYQDADLIALLESPEYFLQLPLNLRGDSGYIDALIDGINNTDSGEIGEKIYLLSEINFSSWSVVVQVFKRIGSSELMREIQANVDGNTLNGFITNALYAFDMLSPDRQFAAMQQDDEVEIINMLQGFQELQGDIEKIRVKNRNIADIAEEVNIDFTYPATLSFINNSFDSDTDRAEIMSIFREHNGNDVQFSNKFMEFLLSKNLGRFEVEALFEGILEAQEEDLANLQDNIVFDNEETLGEEYTGLLERGEDGETRISDEFGEIWHQFREERGEELTEMTDNEIIELFFESRNISQMIIMPRQ
ncbi:hypothetical protein LAT59_02495 [Candidatus Gracilibacteria bacterium]|nr:hypothetical protein [Candidatus Gracilibacteria bacterium]